MLKRIFIALNVHIIKEEKLKVSNRKIGFLPSSALELAPFQLYQGLQSLSHIALTHRKALEPLCQCAERVETPGVGQLNCSLLEAGLTNSSPAS